MELARNLLLLFLPCFCVAEQCNYKAFPGLVQNTMHLKNVSAESKLACVISSCRCDPTCSVSFNSNNRQCVVSNQGGRFPDSINDPAESAIIIYPGNEDWITLVVILQIPSGLWRFDNEHRGTNLGSKGAVMDCTTDGLTWGEPGPPGLSSGFVYPRKDVDDGSTTPKLPLKSEGKNLLDFSKPYTITVWLKTDVDKRKWFLILEGFPKDTIDFWFYPTSQIDQIQHTPFKDLNQYYRTVINATGKSHWRHIAVVYESVTQVRIYLNSTPWQLETVANGAQTVSYPDYFCLWQHCGVAGSGFWGSMACLSIYERALSASEIRAVMNACPR